MKKRTNLLPVCVCMLNDHAHKITSCWLFAVVISLNMLQFVFRIQFICIFCDRRRRSRRFVFALFRLIFVVFFSSIDRRLVFVRLESLHFSLLLMNWIDRCTPNFDEYAARKKNWKIKQKSLDLKWKLMVLHFDVEEFLFAQNSCAMNTSCASSFPNSVPRHSPLDTNNLPRIQFRSKEVCWGANGS